VEVLVAVTVGVLVSVGVAVSVGVLVTVGVAVGAVYLSRTSRNAPRATILLLIAYISIAAGLLFKGPIGAVLPAAVVGLHLLIEGQLPSPWRGRAWLRLLHELGLWWGAPLVLVLTLP